MFQMIRHTEKRRAAAHHRRLQRQRGGDGRRTRSSAGCPQGYTNAPLYAARREPVARADEGGDAQPSDRDLAVPRRGDRRRRRDPRRRRDRARLRGRRPGSPASASPTCTCPAPTSRGSREQRYGKPEHIASALQIMIDGPLGGAAFNNEFGRPNLCGYFRVYEQTGVGGGDAARGYHKPIMIAGGLGAIAASQTHKIEFPPARCWSSSAARACASAWAAARRARWPPAPTPPSSTSIRCSAATPRSSGARRRSSTIARRSATRTRSSRSTTSAPAASRTPSPSSSTAPGAAPRFDLRKVPVEESGLAPKEIWCNESQERYVMAVRRKRCRCSTRCACASAARTPSSASRPMRASSSSARSTRSPRLARRSRRADRHADGRSARQAAEDAPRRAPPSLALPPLDLADVELGRRRVRRAAPPDRRQQALPDHDRRPHRRRPVVPRPDGRAVAGAGRRLRDHARRLPRLRRRGDGDGRAHAARRRRCAGIGPDGGRRGDHQPARRADRARSRQAQLQLDGRVQRRSGVAGRRRRALRHGEGGRHGAVPRARHRRSGRQGQPVDADALAGRRRRGEAGDGAGQPRRHRVREHRRRPRRIRRRSCVARRHDARPRRPRPRQDAHGRLDAGAGHRTVRRRGARPRRSAAAQGRSSMRSRACAMPACCSRTTTAATAASGRRRARWRSPATSASASTSTCSSPKATASPTAAPSTATRRTGRSR